MPRRYDRPRQALRAGAPANPTGAVNRAVPRTGVDSLTVHLERSADSRQLTATYAVATANRARFASRLRTWIEHMHRNPHLVEDLAAASAAPPELPLPDRAEPAATP